MIIFFYLIRYSPCRAFKLELNEVNDQAGQREVIAENLQANVLRELNLLVKDFKDDRKKHLQEGARLMTTLTGQIGNLERARKAYEKAFREAERALENYQRADADFNLSRAEVEKQRMNMTVKTQQSEEAKTEYANQLQKTNEMQTSHYHTAMPDVFQHLQVSIFLSNYFIIYYLQFSKLIFHFNFFFSYTKETIEYNAVLYLFCIIFHNIYL